MRLPTAETPILTKITRNKTLHTFKDCVGALDGTHILAHVPEGKCAAYRNRKAQLSQNVLAACDMDMKFIYVLSGWEGSAADSRVFEDARSTDFNVPEGRYYLGDAGYAISDSLLVPYRGVRYHIKEWGQTRQRYVHILTAHIFKQFTTLSTLDLGITRSSSITNMPYFEITSNESLAFSRGVSRSFSLHRNMTSRPKRNWSQPWQSFITSFAHTILVTKPSWKTTIRALMVMVMEGMVMTMMIFLRSEGHAERSLRWRCGMIIRTPIVVTCNKRYSLDMITMATFPVVCGVH